MLHGLPGGHSVSILLGSSNGTTMCRGATPSAAAMARASIEADTPAARLDVGDRLAGERVSDLAELFRELALG
jgi:hypothetical protein